MSKSPRRNFSPEFKAKVALEALKEDQTLSEIAAKYELHPVQITDWKKQLSAGSSSVFEKGKNAATLPATDAQDPEKEALYKTVGQLKMKNDWLKKKSEQVFGKGFQTGFGK